MKKIAILATALAMSVLAAGALTAQEAETDELHAWFTAEQAEQGQRTYAVSCGGCHGVDMVDIFAGYSTAEEYYLFISGSMPADNPGSLSNQQYVDIIAYLMNEVGFPAGEETLEFDRETLRQIVPAEAAGAE